jgi:hypothetical protein
MEIENSYNTVVATPVNEYKPAGIYSASFDASGFPEGIYFYTIECKGVNNTYYSKSTKSMILIK